MFATKTARIFFEYGFTKMLDNLLVNLQWLVCFHQLSICCVSWETNWHCQSLHVTHLLHVFCPSFFLPIFAMFFLLSLPLNPAHIAALQQLYSGCFWCGQRKWFHSWLYLVGILLCTHSSCFQTMYYGGDFSSLLSCTAARLCFCVTHILSGVLFFCSGKTTAHCTEPLGHLSSIYRGLCMTLLYATDIKIH